MSRLKSHLWPACRLTFCLILTLALSLRRMSLLTSHLWPPCRPILRPAQAQAQAIMTIRDSGSSVRFPHRRCGSPSAARRTVRSI